MYFLVGGVGSSFSVAWLTCAPKGKSSAQPERRRGGVLNNPQAFGSLGPTERAAVLLGGQSERQLKGCHADKHQLPGLCRGWWVDVLPGSAETGLCLVVVSDVASCCQFSHMGGAEGSSRAETMADEALQAAASGEKQLFTH